MISSPRRSRLFATALLLPLSMSLLFPISTEASPRRISPWAKVPGPTSGEAESIGRYAGGCLRGGKKLPPDGAGYQAVRLKRDRHYGHPSLISFIEELSAETRKKGEPAILVGDMGLPRGGPTLTAHASHQTGLDADIWYWRPGRKLSRKERESLSAKRMINPRLRAVDGSAFGASEVKLLKRVAESESVDRVLVNYALKKALCEKHGEESWIRKIRPWAGHDYHFHVRLKCPPQDTQCNSQGELPLGNGCDESLAWWWSEEARSGGAKTTKVVEAPKKPPLPEACHPVLAEGYAPRRNRRIAARKPTLTAKNEPERKAAID